jgi:peptidoglycan hydrolase CwlO-like protein
VTVVELRHQLTEKDKNFSKIVEELQSANQTGNDKYDEVKAKLSKVESDLKIKTIEIDQLRRELERKEKDLSKKK